MVTVDFPLKRHVSCGEHGAVLTGYIKKGNPYYKCNTIGCKGSNTSAKLMMLFEYVVPQELKSILEKVISRKFQQNNERAYDSRKSIESRLNEFKTREDNVCKKYAFGDIDKGAYKPEESIE